MLFCGCCWSLLFRTRKVVPLEMYAQKQTTLGQSFVEASALGTSRSSVLLMAVVTFNLKFLGSREFRNGGPLFRARNFACGNQRVSRRTHLQTQTLLGRHVPTRHIIRTTRAECRDDGNNKLSKRGLMETAMEEKQRRYNAISAS
jgi:hypothetical protein